METKFKALQCNKLGKDLEDSLNHLSIDILERNELKANQVRFFFFWFFIKFIIYINLKKKGLK